MIPSWEAIVRTPETRDQAVNVVHGALAHYDLPDLIGLTETSKTTIVDTVDVMGRLIQ
jgi:hypothetical protein